MPDESADVQHQDLPIPDYDHLPVGDLGHRIRSLPAGDLQTLLAYERAHGDRLPVVQLLQVRLEEVQGGAEPSGGDPSGIAPSLTDTAQGGSPVSPQTQGPPINPPSQGVPTNPAQPRR
ncbi:hypothetical protein [uncultured Cellulomonas sp.]|uniref:hypothetical protein n=1 Tax=uncultured Cellulomonas sp. TaxID=189682 RepID=UPI00260230B6|nr:hypothetical protein [uncultured Cellulomonas sp.]